MQQSVILATKLYFVLAYGQKLSDVDVTLYHSLVPKRRPSYITLFIDALSHPDAKRLP